MTDAEVDALLAGRYRLVERIAAGGMGEVWRGLDTVLERPVAVKTLRPEHADDEEFRTRLHQEARHAAGLSHPGIASVYDVGESGPGGGTSWLVMELVAGRPLSDLLLEGPLPLDQALDVVGQTGLALQAAHDAGVVHRDVKPGNLLVRADGVVKVTDFGIAHALGTTTSDGVPQPRSGTVVGTAYYLSPEQAGGRPVSPASDVYALGVVAHECLTGQRPFPGRDAAAIAAAHLFEPPPPLPDTVPAAVRALVASALAKHPGDRPADAGTFGRTALALRGAPADLLDTTPAGTRTTGATTGVASAGGTAGGAATATGADPQVLRRRRRPRGLALAAVLLTVVLLALLARAVVGPVPDTVPVPDVSGQSVADARDALEDAGLVVRQSPGGTPSAGTVTGTDPAAGQVLPTGAEVALVVSGDAETPAAGSVAGARAGQQGPA